MAILFLCEFGWAFTCASFVSRVWSTGDVNLTVPDVIGLVFGVIFATFYVKTKHYLANNILGVAFCLQVCSFRRLRRTP